MLGVVFAGCLEPVAEAPCTRTLGEVQLFSQYLSAGPMPRTSADVWLTRFKGLTPDLTAEIDTTGPIEVQAPGSLFGVVGFWIRRESVRQFYVRSAPSQPTELRSIDFPGATYESRSLSQLVASFPGSAHGRLASNDKEASVCLWHELASTPASLVTIADDGGVTTTPAPFNQCVDSRGTSDGPVYLAQTGLPQSMAVFVGSPLRAFPISAPVQDCRFTLGARVDLVCLGSDPAQLVRIHDSAEGSANTTVVGNDAGWVLIGAVPDLDDVFLVRDAAAEADGAVSVWALVQGEAPQRVARLFISDDFPPLYGGSPSGNLVVGSRTDAGAVRFVEYCLR